MFNVVICALIFCALITAPAHAGPAVGIVSTVAGWFGGGAIATALVQMGASIILNKIAAKLMGSKATPRAEETRMELQAPTSLPAYRFVYGRTWATGTPVAWVVKGKKLFICYLLNSRPSALNTHQVFFDKRPTNITGDPFSFSGSGASITTAIFSGLARYWIGRGSQTTCPAPVVSESGGYFSSADAWTGNTVLWAILDCGDNARRTERWPSSPPNLDVMGNWSMVYDPRDGEIKFSRNQALIVLDALKSNPIRPYPDAHLRLDTFEWGADVAAQKVDTKAGDQIDRYAVDGTLIWGDGSELEDQIGPLLDAGASRMSRVGGQLAFVPAIDRAPIATITEFTDGQPLELTRWQPSDELYTECVASYVNADRDYEMAEAPAHIVPGAQVEDGGIAKRLDLSLPFVKDHRQAQRLAKIFVMRSRHQRKVTGETFPDVFEIVAGSVVTLGLPDPFTGWNAKYEVESVSPLAGLNDDQSITIRLPIVLQETSAAIYAWDHATEEQSILPPPARPEKGQIAAPTALIATTGGDAALINGSTVIPRIQLDWTASSGASLNGYEWQYRMGGGEWMMMGSANDTGVLRDWLTDLALGTAYTFRVRSVGEYGTSAWTVSGSIIAAGLTEVLTAPAIRNIAGSTGRIDLSFKQSGHIRAETIELWSGTANNVTLATLLATLNAGPNVQIDYDHVGLGTAETRYYWVRARNAAGSSSAFSAVASATTA